MGNIEVYKMSSYDRHIAKQARTKEVREALYEILGNLADTWSEDFNLWLNQNVKVTSYSIDDPEAGSLCDVELELI
jgi:hypothetical protein